jgi:hypothetical protein
MPEPNQLEQRDGVSVRMWRTEFVATLLLGLAAVGTGWAAYQSAMWDTDSLFTLDRADVARRRAVLAESRGSMLRMLDVGLFTAYAQAMNRHDEGFAQFLFQRLRPPMKTALTAWLATKPLQNPDAPPTPFVMKEYRLAEDEEARRLNDEGERILARARWQDDVGDRYVLITVPFAVASLFAGISTKFRSPSLCVAIVAMGVLAFVAAVVALMRMPVA